MPEERVGGGVVPGSVDPGATPREAALLAARVVALGEFREELFRGFLFFLGGVLPIFFLG